MSEETRPDAPLSERRNAETHRVIKGRRWRVSDPALDDDLRQLLVNALMDARRSVKQALGADDGEALAAARSRVGDAKVALGERGPKWWVVMTDDDIATRVECGRRALESVGEQTDSVDDLRRRFKL